MNPFDMAVVVILGYSVILGIFRGLVRELAAILAIVCGFYLAYSHYHSVAPIFGGWISSPLYANVAGFFLLFCGIYAGITVLGLLLRTLMKVALLGLVDRLLGALFGAFKGVVIVGVLFFLLTTFLPGGGAAVVRQSRLAPAVNSIAGAIAHIIPENDRESAQKKMQALKQKWNGGPAVAPPVTQSGKKPGQPPAGKTGD